MKYLHLTSWIITLLGLVITIASRILDIDPMWLLAGVLLTWAGIVKIIIVQLWTRLAKLGTDEHVPEHSA